MTEHDTIRQSVVDAIGADPERLADSLILLWFASGYGCGCYGLKQYNQALKDIEAQIPVLETMAIKYGQITPRSECDERLLSDWKASLLTSAPR